MTDYYFPAIYPDEILYSCMARFHAHVGSGSRRATSAILFGCITRTTCLDLPRHVPELYERWLQGSGWGFEEFVTRTTLLPYYTAYASAEVRSSAMAAMRANCDELHLRLGISGYGVDRPKTMRFCSACHGGMKSTFGERYWKRVHQLPGVLVCPEHALPLRSSAIQLPLTGRYDFHTVDDASCPSNAPFLFDRIKSPLFELLWETAAASAKALEQPPPPRSLEEAGTKLRLRAEMAGYRRPGSSIYLSRVTEAFDAQYGSALPMLGLRGLGSGKNGWLRDMLRPHRNAFHPLQHIVLNIFLDREERCWLSRIGRCPPEFGDGPWPCRNPLCPHLGQATINEAVWSRQKRRMVGHFKCGCGYTYTRSIDPAGKVGPPRFRSFGGMLETPLRIWIAEGWSSSTIGRRIGLSAKSVERAALSMGLTIRTSARNRRNRGSCRLERTQSISSRSSNTLFFYAGLSKI